MVGIYVAAGILGAFALFLMIGSLLPCFEPDVDYDP